MAHVLHLAPFDASKYPPIIGAVRAAGAAGVTSTVLSTIKPRAAEALPPATVRTPGGSRSGRAQLLWLGREARRVLAREGADLVIAHNARGLLVGVLLGPACPLLYHCHDFEHGNRVLRTMERLGVRRAAEMWVPAEERRDVAVRAELRVPVVIVRNCPPLHPEAPVGGGLRTWLRDRGVAMADTVPLVIRHGGIGRSQYIRETVEALPSLPGGAVFVVIGEGDAAYVASCQARARELGVADRLFFHPFVPHGRLFGLLADATVAMNVYAPTGANAAMPAPNKVYESMAAGVPVVVGAGNSVARDVLEAGAGAAVAVGDVSTLAGALAVFFDSARRRAASEAARRAHVDRFHYEAQLAPTRLGALLRAQSRT